MPDHSKIPDRAVYSAAHASDCRPWFPPEDRCAPSVFTAVVPPRGVPAVASMEAYANAALRTLTGPDVLQLMRQDYDGNGVIGGADLARITEACVLKGEARGVVSSKHNQLVVIAQGTREEGPVDPILGAFLVPAAAIEDEGIVYGFIDPLSIVMALGHLAWIDERMTDHLDYYLGFCWYDRNPPTLTRSEMNLVLQTEAVMWPMPSSYHLSGMVGLSITGDDLRHYDFTDDLSSWRMRQTNQAHQAMSKALLLAKVSAS